MKTANPTRLAQRRYLVRFTIAMVAYIVVLTGSLLAVGRFEPAGFVRWALLLAPLVPIGFMIPIMVGYLRETDEFERRIVTESLAIAAGITAALSVTYGFLENAGLPHLSAWWTWAVVMGSWAISRIFVSRHYAP